MKQLVILSGKGGTGKTTVTASFAALSKQAVIVDADVDAADLHLLLDPTIIETGEYSGGSKAEIDPQICIHCDDCRTHCRFDAIGEDHMVDPLACEGCGLCTRVCPVEAASMKPALSGHWYRSETPYGPFVHAKLGIAAENSGKLVAQIREKSQHWAKEEGRKLILIDGSPGVGCPVIASITGCDGVLCVTEPTPSGLHDLKRVGELADHFKIPMMIAINKADLNDTYGQNIHDFACEKGIPVVGELPFDPAASRAIAEASPLVEVDDGPLAVAIRTLFATVMEKLASDETD